MEDRRGGGEEEENDFRMNERRPGFASRAGDSLQNKLLQSGGREKEGSCETYPPRSALLSEAGAGSAGDVFFTHSDASAQKHTQSLERTAGPFPPLKQ